MIQGQLVPGLTEISAQPSLDVNLPVLHFEAGFPAGFNAVGPDAKTIVVGNGRHP